MKTRRHLSYANVTATVALFVALGGGAYAVSRVDSRDIVNDSVKSADLKNRKAVTGLDVKRNSLTGRQISEATLNAGRFALVAGDETVDCNPSSTTTFTNCVATSLHLRSRSRVLVIATGNQESVGGPGQASCRLRVDRVAETLAVDPGEQMSDNTSGTATNGFARTIVSRELSPGRHTLSLACLELAGNVRIDVPTIAAIAIGSG